MEAARRRRFRLSLGFFLFGLVVSGVTAFPLLLEVRLLTGWLGALLPKSHFLLGWLETVLAGLEDVHARYPWMPYGSDWLAFGHLVIALFFIPAWRDPASSRPTLHCGIWACLGVIPLALICGAVRGIPFWWRLIDCSFGLIGLVPLWICLRQLDPPAR